MAGLKWWGRTAVALLLLAGCASNGSSDTADQTAPDPASAESSEAATSASSEPIDELDLTELVADDDQTANVEGNDPDNSETENAAQPQTQTAIEAAAFSACMRDQGIDFPDLELTGEGTVSIRTLLARINLGDRLIESGMAQCQGELGESFADQLILLFNNRTLEDGLADFSSCIREAGYDVGDIGVADLVADALSLTDGDETSTDRLLAAGLGLDPNNPSDLAAVDNCDEIVAKAISDLGLGD